MPNVGVNNSGTISGENKQAKVELLSKGVTLLFRFTAEANEKLLRSAGFDVERSFVGGDGLWSVFWLLRCGMLDMPAAALRNTLRERTGKEYEHDSYMLSMQIARRPWYQ